MGVIGCQGVGKSTILSLLANGLAEKDKGFVESHLIFGVFTYN